MRSIETFRLILEPQTAAHAEAMYGVLCDPAIYEFENAPPASAEALRERYRQLESRTSPDGRQQWLNWVVRLREPAALIGYVQATVLPDGNALVAYEFNSAWWGRGLASEAVSAAIDELRDRYRVGAIGAIFKRSNARSRRLLARMGMRVADAGEFPGTLMLGDEAAMVLDP